MKTTEQLTDVIDDTHEEIIRICNLSQTLQAAIEWRDSQDIHPDIELVKLITQGLNQLVNNLHGVAR